MTAQQGGTGAKQDFTEHTVGKQIYTKFHNVGVLIYEQLVVCRILMSSVQRLPLTDYGIQSLKHSVVFFSITFKQITRDKNV